jgi:hypothetical protein
MSHESPCCVRSEREPRVACDVVSHGGDRQGVGVEVAGELGGLQDVEGVVELAAL